MVPTIRPGLRPAAGRSRRTRLEEMRSAVHGDEPPPCGKGTKRRKSQRDLSHSHSKRSGIRIVSNFFLSLQRTTHNYYAMKKLLFFCAALTATFTATGQHYYTDSANPDITRHSLRIRPAARRVRTARSGRLHRLQGRPAHPFDLLGRRLHARIPRPRSVVRRSGRAGHHRTRGVPPPRGQDAQLPQRLRSGRHRTCQLQHHRQTGRRAGNPVRPELPGKAGAGDGREVRHHDHSGRGNHPANRSPTVTTTRFSPPTTMRSTPPTPCNRCATPRRRGRW